MEYVSKKVKTSSLVVMVLVIFIAASPIQAQWSVGGLLNISNTSFLVDPEPNSADYSPVRIWNWSGSRPSINGSDKPSC